MSATLRFRSEEEYLYYLEENGGCMQCFKLQCECFATVIHTPAPEPRFACADNHCPRGTSTVWPNKPHTLCVHCAEAVNPNGTKTTYCSNFNKVGGCKFGSQCRFIHKVCACKNGVSCPHGENCNFGRWHQRQLPITPPVQVSNPVRADVPITPAQVAEAEARSTAWWQDAYEQEEAWRREQSAYDARF